MTAERAASVPVVDRRVHAEWAQMQVVRYERAGKWYLEPCGEYAHLPRQLVTVSGAARYAQWLLEQPGGTVHVGLPGGGTFERKVRGVMAAKR